MDRTPNLGADCTTDCAASSRTAVINQLVRGDSSVDSAEVGTDGVTVERSGEAGGVCSVVEGVAWGTEYGSSGWKIIRGLLKMSGEEEQPANSRAITPIKTYGRSWVRKRYTVN